MQTQLNGNVFLGHCPCRTPHHANDLRWLASGEIRCPGRLASPVGHWCDHVRLVFSNNGANYRTMTFGCVEYAYSQNLTVHGPKRWHFCQGVGMSMTNPSDPQVVSTRPPSAIEHCRIGHANCVASCTRVF